MKARLLLMALALVTMAATCARNGDDNDDDDDDGNGPKNSVIVINTPAGNTFAPGETVHITGYITHPGELHGYEIKVGTEDDKDRFLKVERHLHGRRLDFDESFVNHVPANTDAIIKVEAKLGHGEGDFEREMVIHLRRDQ